MDERANGLVLGLRRVFHPSRERVYRALTEPAQLAAWWGPLGFRIPEIDLDLRVGGRYRFTMAPPDGEPFHLSGEFLAIDAPSRLAYSFRKDGQTKILSSRGTRSR